MKSLARAALGAVLGLASAASLAGCATVSLGELPDAPIAIVYRDPETARQRAEAMLDRSPGGIERDRARRKDGIAPLDVMGRQAGALLGAAREERREHAGRLALLDARNDRVTVVRGARLGAIPLDWSADHQRLLFAQLDEEFMQLYEYDAASGEVRPLTQGPAVHPRGCFSSDDRLVHMTVGLARGEVVTRIDLTEPGGIDPQPISPGPRDHSPTCAPDGSAVAWVDTPLRGRPTIMVRQPIGSAPRRLTPGREPSFSRDGAWILYSAPVGQEWQLWRIRPDGTGRARVGPGGVEDQHPSVSPDGRFVVYVVENDFRQSLHVRRFDGTGDRILFNDGDGDRPVW